MTTARAVYLVLERPGAMVLIARRCNTGYQDGMFQVVAGHAEAGELPKEAMIREAKEEIGIDINPEDLEFVHVSSRPQHDPTGDRLDFYFRVLRWKGEPRIMEPDKCDDIRWIQMHDLPSNTTPHVRYAIEKILEGVMYSELDLKWIKEQPEYGIK